MTSPMIETDEIPGVDTAPLPDDPSAPIVLTKAQFDELMARAASGGRPLPPGAYYDDDGNVKRKVPHPTGRTRTKPDGTRVGIYQMHEREVILPADTSLKAFRAARREAITEGKDVYKPRVGWLRFGYFKEVDHPDNLGDGVRDYEIHEEPILGQDADPGSPTTTAIGGDSAEAAAARTAKPATPAAPRRGRQPRQAVPDGIDYDTGEAV